MLIDEGRAARSGAMLRIPLWLVWAVALGFVLAELGSFGILDNNEGLYAEIPREMLSSGDWRLWVIPHLNGLPYMEKPPLLYWLTALSFALFGQNEWSARAVPAASALACVALLLWFGAAVKRPQVGRLAALMFVSGVGVTVMSHVLMFDMLLTALLTAALMGAYRALTEDGVRFVRAAYALLALALLAKSVFALIVFGLVMACFILSTSRSLMEFLSACRKLFEPWALLIFCAIAVPWHLVASLTEPIFAWFYFINEHVLRFIGKPSVLRCPSAIVDQHRHCRSWEWSNAGSSCSSPRGSRCWRWLPPSPHGAIQSSASSLISRCRSGLRLR
jgi:4-amino-4-deoxy-L-arabinose transferase-like glycosyltransferase